MAALLDITFGFAFLYRISSKSSQGSNQSAPFSHALMAAL